MVERGNGAGRVGLALFTAGMARKDVREAPFPVVAESLPQLNTNSWVVFPDGRMETTHVLRPSLSWHDGTPLSAEDFVLAWRVIAAQDEWGLQRPTFEYQQMEAVIAADPRTVVIRWRHPFPDAAAPELLPLPRHILEEPLAQGQPDAFAAHSYWTTGFIGAGPYRIDRWERGAFIDAAAFDGFALGRPKIDRFRLTWIADPNVALARLLAGDSHVAADSSLYFQQAAILKREWAATGAGQLVLSPNQLRYVQVQFRPEYVSPIALHDLRVRKALLHAIDRQALSEALLEGEGMVADSSIPPAAEAYAGVDRAIAKYPYDLRRAEALLREAGFTKGTDGFYASPTLGRFTTEVRGVSAGQEAQETTIVSDDLRRAGIDNTLNLLPAAQRSTDEELKGTFPGLTTNWKTLGISLLNSLQTSTVAGPSNRWTGLNRSGWSNPEFDRLFELYNTTLDRPQRNQHTAAIMKLLTEELPILPMYFNFEAVAHVSNLQGPEPFTPESSYYGNIHTWQWREGA